jgi:hypothetical protein
MKNLNGLIIYFFLSFSFVVHSISAQIHISWEIFDAIITQKSWSEKYNSHYEECVLTDTILALNNIEIKITGYLFFEDSTFKNIFLYKSNGFNTNCIFNCRDYFDIIQLELDEKTLELLLNSKEGNLVTISGIFNINESNSGNYPFSICVSEIKL